MEQKEHPEDSKKPKKRPGSSEQKQKADSENTGRGLEFWLHRHPKSVSESYMHFYAKKQYEEEQRKRLGIPEQPKQQPKPSDKTQKAESENTGHSLEFWLHRHPKSVSESYMHFYAKKQYEEEQRKRSEDSKRAEPRQD